ncbi:MAG TPA: MFS transporter [Reyranellaceae bacterium]|nr:MFS transporter [Reyranellaceae bacterium]
MRTGLFIAFAAFLGSFATIPGQTVGVSSFIDPIATDLAMDREHVLALYSIGTFLGILTAPTIGRQVDRFGPRTLIVPIVVALALACAVLSQAREAWSLAMGFVLLRATAIAGLSLVSSHMVNLWFDRFRGRITAVAAMGFAVGGLVIPQAAELVVRAEGWRVAYLTLGAGVLVLMVPVGLAFFRNRPADAALRDFGCPGPPAAAPLGDGFTLRQATGTVTFWYLVALTLLVNAVNTALLLDHARALGEAGLTRDTAIALLGAVTVTQAIATLAGGVLVDRFGARPVGMLGLMILAASVILVMMAPTLASGLAYAACLGAMIGILQVSHSAGLAEAFGTAHIGSIRGATSVIGVTGAALGPLPLLWSAEAAYWIFLILTAGGLVLGLVSRRR